MSPKSGSASRKTNGLLSWDWKQENYHDSLANAAIACESERGPALQGQEFDSIESNEVRVSLLVDEELAPRAIPERIYARKPCASAYERPPTRSLTFGKLFPAAAAASKSRRPKGRGRPQNRGDRRGCEPFRPEPVVTQGQGVRLASTSSRGSLELLVLGARI